MLNNKFEIIQWPAYRAVGLRWDGSWDEISELKNIIHTMSKRVDELGHALNPHVQLGLSYHLRPDGFVHYSVYEVNEQQPIPEGMIEIRIPAYTYLKTHHQGGNIGETYQNIMEWMKDSDYAPYSEPGVTYYDKQLPIKHEWYPADRDNNDPHFDILIPIVMK